MKDNCIVNLTIDLRFHSCINHSFMKSASFVPRPQVVVYLGLNPALVAHCCSFVDRVCHVTDHWGRRKQMKDLTNGCKDCDLHEKSDKICYVGIYRGTEVYVYMFKTAN